MRKRRYFHVLLFLSVLPLPCRGASLGEAKPQLTWGTTCAEKGVDWTGQGWRVWGEASDHQGNQYVGMKMPVEPFSPERDGISFRVSTGEPETTCALYVRLYDEEGQRIDSWRDWSCPFREENERTFYLQRGLSMGGFSYEDREAQPSSSDEAQSLEIIVGTKEKGVPFECTLLDFRSLVQRYKSFEALSRPKRLLLDTDLSGGVYLSLPGEGGVGEAIQAALDDLGVQWETWEEERDPRKSPPKKPILCVGQLANNPLAAALYHNRYVASDDLYPGEGGTILRTVHDPWGIGQNVLFLGGSRAEDCLKGLEELKERIGPDRVLPRCLSVRLGPAAQKAFGSMARSLSREEIEGEIEKARQDLEVGRHCGLTPRICQAGMNAYYGGGEGWARLFERLMDLWYEHALSDPGTYGGRWGMDADFRLREMVVAWDLVEEDPFFTEEDRLRMTRILFEYVKDCAPKARGVLGSKRIRHNHETFPALGLYFAGKYFQGAYSAYEAEEWLKIADACFSLQSRSWKPYEDCNGYQWLTLRHLAEFCAARPMEPFFEDALPGMDRSASEEAVRMCLLTMDNLGYQVPYGDCASPFGWFSEMSFLRVVVAANRDPSALWCERRKETYRPVKGLHACPVRGEGRTPDHLLGVRLLETSPLYYESFAKEGDPPVETTFDKIAFRNSFEAEDSYLLLDGLGNGGHGHRDVQALLRYTDRDRIWLADCDYFKALPAVHNTLVATRDGMSGTRSAFAERAGIFQWKDWSASSTSLELGMGALWRRKILCFPKAGVLVLDQVEAQKAGTFDVRVLWQLLGDLEWEGHGGTLRQGEEGLCWNWLGTDRVWMEEDWESGENWKVYEHASPVVRRVSCQSERELEEGQSLALWSAWGRSEDPFEGSLLANGAVHFTDGLTEEPLVVWGRCPELPLGLRCEGRGGTLLWALEDALFGMGVSSLSLPGEMIAREKGTSFSFHVDFAEGTLWVEKEGQWERSTAKSLGKGKDAWTQWFRRQSEEAQLVKEEERRQRKRPGETDVPKSRLQDGQTWKLEKHWSVFPQLEEGILSVTEQPGAVRVPLQVTSDKAPREKNLFSGQGQRLEAVMDGRRAQTSECVIWSKGEDVELALDWGESFHVERVTLYAWFSSTSSKGEGVGVSSVGLVDTGGEGKRTVRWIEEEGKRQDWGGSPHRPVSYEWELKGEPRQGLTLLLKPWEGRSVYVAEVEVLVSSQGVEAERLKGPGWRTGCVANQGFALVDGRGDLFLVDERGETLWQRSGDAGYLVVSAFDVDGDGSIEVLVGGEGASLDCFDLRGDLLWRMPFPRYKRDAVVRVLFPARLRSEEPLAAVAGTDSWRYYAVDGHGETLWMVESVHRSTVGSAFDLDGDGREEVFLGTEYYWWPCVSPEGKRLWKYSPGSPKVCSVTSGDVGADGSLEVFLGGADGTLHALNAQGKCLWKRKTGDAVTGLVSGDVDGDGSIEILAGNAYGTVLCFDGEGGSQWVRSIHSPVTKMLLLNGPREKTAALFVGMDNGRICGFDGTGDPVLSEEGKGGVAHLEAWHDLDQEKTRGLFAVRGGEAALFLSRLP